MKQIRSYFIEKYDSGIYHILFNTEDRWVDYHRYNDEMYMLGGQDIEVEPFLPKEGRYIKAVMQEKDQVSWYFIPWELLGIKNRRMTGRTILKQVNL